MLLELQCMQRQPGSVLYNLINNLSKHQYNMESLCGAHILSWCYNLLPVHMMVRVCCLILYTHILIIFIIPIHWSARAQTPHHNSLTNNFYRADYASILIEQEIENPNRLEKRLLPILEVYLTIFTLTSCLLKLFLCNQKTCIQTLKTQEGFNCQFRYLN